MSKRQILNFEKNMSGKGANTSLKGHNFNSWCTLIAESPKRAGNFISQPLGLKSCSLIFMGHPVGNLEGEVCTLPVWKVLQISLMAC